jgi:ABC-type multidrug transport system fused ATPase/permease subunit
VQQEPFLFNGTIFENVAHGLIGTRWEAETEDTKRSLVVEACEEAFADEFISRLPEVGFIPCFVRKVDTESIDRAMTPCAATQASTSVEDNDRGLQLLGALS